MNEMKNKAVSEAVTLTTPDEPTSAPVLRAMAMNYAEGHLWDKLDARTCLHAANEIDRLRALLATGGLAQAVEQEPFGYFKAEPFGWTDCGPDDEGAVALYEQPQAQADARDAEQERWMGIGKAIERACVDLPAGAEINIHLEKDAGTVTLSDCDGDEQENFPTDEGFAGVVNAAIDAAIAAAKGNEQ